MNAKEILEKLVSFDVLSTQNNLALLKWIENYLKSFNVEVFYVYSEDKAQASIHCRIGPAVDGGVILSGHTDVVPVAGQKWDTNPFELIEKNGKLFGRGSCDMKGYLACCLAVVPQMVKANLKKPIYLAFSYDEEIGCLSAPELAKKIKLHYKEKPKFAIIGEPSMLQPIIGQKGIVYVKTEVNGSGGHSSAIHKEVSAIHESTKLISWLKNKMFFLAKHSIDHHFTPPHTTLHVGQFNAGIATNIVADKAVFEWDIRSIPQDSIQAVFEEFEDFCKTEEERNKILFPDFKITNTKLHPIVPGLQTKKEKEVVNFIQEVSKNNTVNYVAYATEAGQFAEAGFESVICGPGSITQAHRPNEFITVAQLNLGVEMIERIVEVNSN